MCDVHILENDPFKIMHEIVIAFVWHKVILL